jgi:WD40 repeat protein
MIKRNLFITLFVFVTITTIICGHSTTADKAPNAPEPVEIKGQTAQVNSVALPPDEKADNTARIEETTTEKEVQKLDRHIDYVKSAAFSPDGHTDVVTSVSFSPNGKTVLIASVDDTAKIWDVETGKELQKFEGHTKGLESASFSPDGKTVLTASDDKTVRIWDAETGKELQKFEHTDKVLSASFSPDGKTVLTVSKDKTARIWAKVSTHFL